MRRRVGDDRRSCDDHHRRKPTTHRRPDARGDPARRAQDITEKGVEATSTRDISGALGIAKSALYYHFENKAAIVASLVEERRHEVDDLVDWISSQPAAPDLLERAALRWVESATPERFQIIRFAHANQPAMSRLVENDIRSEFERVVYLLAHGDGTAEERLLARMSFDTISAALLSAQGTDAGPDDVTATARRATVALAWTAARREQDEPGGPT